MFNAFSLGVNRIIDPDGVDYKVVPDFFLWSSNKRRIRLIGYCGYSRAAFRPRDKDQQEMHGDGLLLQPFIANCECYCMQITSKAVADPGKGPPPPPLSQGLDPALKSNTNYDTYCKLWRSYWNITSICPPLSLWILRRIVTYMYMINHTSVWNMNSPIASMDECSARQSGAQ